MAREAAAFDVPFLLEPLAYPATPEQAADPALMGAAHTDLVLETAARLTGLGATVLKMQFPAHPDHDPPDEWAAACAELDGMVAEPWAVLSAGVFLRRVQAPGGDRLGRRCLGVHGRQGGVGRTGRTPTGRASSAGIQSGSESDLRAALYRRHDGASLAPGSGLLVVTAGRLRVAAYARAVWDDQILLARIAPGYPSPGSWTLPGGGLDMGEAPEEALVRELAEETGLDGDVGSILGINSIFFPASADRPQALHWLRIVYHVAVRGIPVGETDGSTDLAAWVPLAEVAALPTVELVDYALTLPGL